MDIQSLSSFENLDHDFLPYQANNFTESDIASISSQVFNGSLLFLSLVLSEWQLSELANVRESESAIRCFLQAWLITQPTLEEGTYCNATWDDFNCWPPTATGVTLRKTCQDAFAEDQPEIAKHMTGYGIKTCLENGSWLLGNKTNYLDCANSYDDYVRKAEEDRLLFMLVKHIIFIGSLLSFVFLTSAVTIFCCFRSLWCDRITIHVHLMLALMLRYLLLIVITEPFVFNRKENYRDVDLLCKTIITVFLYSTESSVNWMFIQGVYLNGKLTTNIFNGKTPFKLYYFIGWVFPFFILLGYAVVMEFRNSLNCWSGYSDMKEIWIILGPMLFALTINLLFFMNILRVLITRAHIQTNGRALVNPIQFRRATKATFILLPILGVNNLLFVYDPGGEFHFYFVIFNTLFASTQGIFVSIVYCFMSNDVMDAFRRKYRRFKVQWSFRKGNTAQRRPNRTTRSNQHPCGSRVIIEHTSDSNRITTHPKTQFSQEPVARASSSETVSIKASPSALGQDMRYLNVPGSSSSMLSSFTSLCSLTENCGNGKEFTLGKVVRGHFTEIKVDLQGNQHMSVTIPLKNVMKHGYENREINVTSEDTRTTAV